MSDRPDTYPIVLAHGICRFDLQNAADTGDSEDDRYHYFRRVRSTLARHGYRAHHSAVSWAAGVDTRARELRDELHRITRDFTLCPKVHIIAHSMGGLDARHMIVDHGMADRVATLATIGTPHLGTSYADWGLARMGSIVAWLGRIGLDISGFRDLTRARCRAFNDRVEEFELGCGVRYLTYAGSETEARTFAPLRRSWSIVHAAEGENDGLVSVESAAWRDEFFAGTFRGDHLNETGWWDVTAPMSLRAIREFEERVLAFYLGIAAALA